MVAGSCFCQAEFANVPGKRHLRGLQARLSELASQLVLGVDRLPADHFQNLPLPIRLVHSINAAKRSAAAASAACTCSGAVPPGTWRLFMPSLGFISAAISGRISGAKAASSDGLQ